METVRPESALLYDDPAPFYPIQVLTFYFYMIPAQLVSLYFLFREEKPQFLWEVTVLEAGAMLQVKRQITILKLDVTPTKRNHCEFQAQFSYIMYSFDPSTPVPFRADWTNQQFWITNLVILIVPHLFLLRLYFHQKSTGKNQKKQN